MTDRLLVDWCTYPPVGHAIEGLQVAYSYHRAGQARVSVVLNRRSATELFACCPWLDAGFTVDLGSYETELPPDPYAGVPREWDWVVEEQRRPRPGQADGWASYTRLSTEAARHYRTWRADPPIRVPESWLRLELPDESFERAHGLLPATSPSIAVMLAGSDGPQGYPSPDSWQLMLTALQAKFPDHQLVVIGKTQGSEPHGHSAWSHVDARSVIELVRAVDAYDLPLLDQLALVSQAQLFFSPHTGFGFAALSVGTPWLTLSGGQWYEYFHNGTPFYSLLPDVARFPAFIVSDGRVIVDDDDGSGPRDASMTFARVRETIDEMLRAAEALIDHRWTYDECLASYFPHLAATLGVAPQDVLSWENIHQRYT